MLRRTQHFITLTKACTTRARHFSIPIGVQWIDAGTPDALVAAALVIQTETRDQSSEFGYVEIAAYRRGYLNQEKLLAIVDETPSEEYAARLRLAVTNSAR